MDGLTQDFPRIAGDAITLKTNRTYVTQFNERVRLCPAYGFTYYNTFVRPGTGSG